MGSFRRFLNRLTETDEERLAEELRTWSESIPGTVRIAEAQPLSLIHISEPTRH